MVKIQAAIVANQTLPMKTWHHSPASYDPALANWCSV